VQRPRSERVIKRQNETLAFAIGHCRRVSHRRGYFITYGERTGRYLDVQSSTGFTCPGTSSGPRRFLSAVNVPELWE